MCGIIGFRPNSNESVEPAVVKWRLGKGMEHMRLRGPDAHGLCQVGRTWLGHVRLSIIDLLGGVQPMIHEPTGMTLTYNGEIFNFRELRKELIGHGRRFVTDSDTEVVLAAYVEWGTACFDRFNGFWAMAIADARSGEIILSRDRLGLKPLYFRNGIAGFGFASSIPALMRLFPSELASPPKLDVSVTSHYLTSRIPFIGGTTLLDGISLLEPGTHLRLDHDGKAVTRKYWSIPIVKESDKSTTSLADAINSVGDVLSDAVESRLVSDVPVGAFLSGGLDSSIITYLTNARHGNDLPLFCAGSDDETSNEFSYAESMAKSINGNLTQLRLDADDFNADWRTLTMEKGLPLSTPNEVSIYRLSLQLKKHCSVTLTGEGADEIFGGYVQPQFGAYDFDRTPRTMDAVDESSDFTWSMRMLHGRAWFMNEVDHFLSCDTWMNVGDKQRLFLPEVWDSIDNDAATIYHYEDFFDTLDGCSSFDKRMYLHARFNLENLLMRVDSSTMAASVEARVPFTDHRLVELAFSLPDTFKMNWRNSSFKEKGRGMTVAQIDAADMLETKILPRRAYADVLPTVITSRRKMSFPVPFAEWLGGELGTSLRSLCLDSKLVRDNFDEMVIDSWFTRKDRRIWLVSNLALWWNEINVLASRISKEDINR